MIKKLEMSQTVTLPKSSPKSKSPLLEWKAMHLIGKFSRELVAERVVYCFYSNSLFFSRVKPTANNMI